MATNTHLKQVYPGLGERLRSARGNESQQIVAVRAGCSTGVVVEAERRDLASPLTVARLARALGLGVAELLGNPTTTTPTDETTPPAPEAT